MVAWETSLVVVGLLALLTYARENPFPFPFHLHEQDKNRLPTLPQVHFCYQ